MPRQFYRMHDLPDVNKAAIELSSLHDASPWNGRGWGIFQTVNAFDGPRRIENLERILAWAVDIDEGDKDSLALQIMNAPIYPSSVIETKRGFQVYFNALNGKAENWNRIVLDRLVPYFGADKNARDIARILRVPGFMHLKDPNDPFPVREVFRCDAAYTEEQIAARFTATPKVEKDVTYIAQLKREQRHLGGDDFWERVAYLDCGYALQQLSGHSAVNGETFEVRPNRNGNANIFVDGKGTSCFVDRAGRIGSAKNGGPLICNWLRYYGLTWPAVYRVLNEVFPELREGK